MWPCSIWQKSLPKASVLSESVSCSTTVVSSQLQPVALFCVLMDWLLRAQWLPFPLRHLKNSTPDLGLLPTYVREKHIGRALRFPGFCLLGWGPLRHCLWKAEGWKRKVSVAEIWFLQWTYSEGTLTLLYGAYLTGDSCLPSTCPWHCAFPLVTVKSRSHWTQRQNPGQDPSSWAHYFFMQLIM